MKTLILAMAMVFMGQMAYADPFLTSDPNPGAEKYRVNIASEGITNEESMADPDGSARHDVGPWPVGTYAGTIEAGAEYVLNGTPQGIWEWSPAVPFDLTKPGPSAPNIGAIVP